MRCKSFINVYDYIITIIWQCFRSNALLSSKKSHTSFLMKAQLLTIEHQISSLLKGLPLEKWPPFFIADLPNLCYFIHEYACLLPERSAISEKLAKNDVCAQQTDRRLSTKVPRANPRSFW